MDEKKKEIKKTEEIVKKELKKPEEKIEEKHIERKEGEENLENVIEDNEGYPTIGKEINTSFGGGIEVVKAFKEIKPIDNLEEIKFVRRFREDDDEENSTIEYSKPRKETGNDNEYKTGQERLPEEVYQNSRLRMNPHLSSDFDEGIGPTINPMNPTHSEDYQTNRDENQNHNEHPEMHGGFIYKSISDIEKEARDILGNEFRKYRIRR
jgi:hypothetical protein